MSERQRRERPAAERSAVLFELVRVTAKRGARVVLEDLSATLFAGATGIVGPSGVGKSTLLRLLNRLADPASGVIRYRGRDSRERDVLGLRRDVGLVAQLPALLEGTVADNVLYGARLAQLNADVADMLGWPDSIRRSPPGRPMNCRSASSSG